MSPIVTIKVPYSIDGGIDYQRLFPVKERMLTFSYKISPPTRPQFPIPATGMIWTMWPGLQGLG